MTRFKVFRLLRIIAAIFVPLLSLFAFISIASGDDDLFTDAFYAILVAVIFKVLPMLCIVSNNEQESMPPAKKTWAKVGRETLSLSVFMWLIMQPEIMALFERVVIRERPLWKWYFIVPAGIITGYFVVSGLRRSLKLSPYDLYPQPIRDGTQEGHSVTIH